jgi:hypothetical protein
MRNLDGAQKRSGSVTWSVPFPIGSFGFSVAVNSRL